MTTAARPTSEQSCHWYAKDGAPVYEVPRSKGEGMRPTTLADARKLRLLPSVTTILGVLHKEALVQWRVEQGILACLTSPQRNDEPLDVFVDRILRIERVQDQESDKAKARGTEIHNAIEKALGWGDFASEEIWPWIAPAIIHINQMGSVVHSENILLGNGYAGKCDLILNDGKEEWIIDFKSTKAAKLPKKSYWEHKLQTAAYANCRFNTSRHANLYISTTRCGEFSFCDNGDTTAPLQAFLSLLQYWQIANNYYP